MAPKTPKSAKRSEKDTLEKDTAAKAAKETEDQTAGSAAAKAAVPDPNISDALDSKPQEDPAVKTTNATDPNTTEVEPAKTGQGDPVKEAADAATGEATKTTEEANGSADHAKGDFGTATAGTGVETGKATEHTEKPEAAASGEKVAHEGIAEAKPTKEVE